MKDEGKRMMSNRAVSPVLRTQHSALSTSLMLAFAMLTILAGCGAETKVTRVDAGVVTDLSGRWNDTDSRMVAEGMVKEALGTPWLDNYTRSHRGKQPVVVVGMITNKSHEHINVQTFVTDLQRELVNSQKVTFVAGRGEREERQSTDLGHYPLDAGWAGPA